MLISDFDSPAFNTLNTAPQLELEEDEELRKLFEAVDVVSDEEVVPPRQAMPKKYRDKYMEVKKIPKLAKDEEVCMHASAETCVYGWRMASRCVRFS